MRWLILFLGVLVVLASIREATATGKRLIKDQTMVVKMEYLSEMEEPEYPAKTEAKHWLTQFIPDRAGLRLWFKGARDIGKDDQVETQNFFRNRTYADFKWSSLFGLTGFASGRLDYMWFGEGKTSDDIDVEPLETYLELTRDSFDIRVGNLILRWGKTDEISPVDNVNPQDIRELFALSLEDRKLPVPMLRVRYHLPSYTFEGIFLPYFKPVRLNYFDTDWAFFRHLKGLVKAANISPQLKDYVRGLSVREEKPASNFRNSEVGFRLLGTFRNFDYGVSAFYTRNRTPFVKNFPVKNLQVTNPTDANQLLEQINQLILAPENIIVEFDRQSILGIEFETTWKKFGLRGELAYFTNQSFLKNDLTSTGRPVIHWVFGVDRNFPSGFYGNLQVSQRIIRHYDSFILFFPEVDTAGFVRLSQGFFRDKFILRLDAYHSFSDDSSYLTPELEYVVSGNLSLSLGSNFIEGPADTFLGQYTDNDQIYLSVVFRY
ncbi:MAG TPA: DUF1302 family protein [Syntrophaceae bacterium]|nr:DUF1302 family protein [Syntrophaceae bacterium]